METEASSTKSILRIPVFLTLVLLSLSPLLTAETVPANPNSSLSASPLLPPPCEIFCPTQWAPYGPFVNRLQFNFYSDPGSEFVNFLAGHLDLPDIQLTNNQAASIIGNQDFQFSIPQGSYFIYGVYFNGASSRFTTTKEFDTGPSGPFWGCDWNSGTPFTSNEQTYISACGINMRQAFAHLVDRPVFARSVGGVPIADPSPPAKDPSGSPVTAQCSWDLLYPSSQYPTCLGPYNFGYDPTGFAQLGSTDFCAAADHMILAGVATGKNPTSCVLTNVNPSVFNHPLRFIARTTDPNRRALFSGLTNAINQLFGGTASIGCFGGSFGCTFGVFTDPPETPIDDWDAYTYGYRLQGTFVDHLFDLFSSQKATDYCGGSQNSEPDNPTFVCLSQLDQLTAAAGQTSSLSTYRIDTLAAFDLYGSHAIDIPVFSPNIRNVALASMDGLVNEAGVGFPNAWSLLNGRQGFYTPVNPAYQFGGGDSSKLRRGEEQPTQFLNVYAATTVWEEDVLSEIYDTLFAANPTTPSQVFCWMCDNYKQSVDSNGNTHFRIELRSALRWQDGIVLDSKDIKFSLLTLRDQGLGGLFAQDVLDVAILNPTNLEIIMRGQGVGLFTELSTAFIVPSHVWELAGDKTYGDVGRADPAKTSFDFDPLTTGSLIGSGPFVCESIFATDIGSVGTGCAADQNGSRVGQTIPVGGSLTLQRYDMTGRPGNTDPFYQYMRSYNTAWGTGTGTAAQSGLLQEFSWADRYDNATVTLRDIASVALCYGASSSSGCSDYSYWIRPAFHPNTPTTISSEFAIVASHLDETWVYPFSWNGVQSQQPGQLLQNVVTFTP